MADEKLGAAISAGQNGQRLSDHAASHHTDGHARVVGEPLAKIDAAAKVTGQTLFADDLVFPRMAFAKLLRSPHPHARIKRIDVGRAAALPGVLATLVGSELPIPFGILPVSQDEHALAPDKVRFVGDPVAAVAALDEETAERALALIDVEYEVLPALMSIDEALARPDARIHDYGPHGNVHKEVSFDFGDVEAGFAEADHVREDTFFFEGNTHLPMEQHAAVAAYGPDGKLTLWSSTQTPHYVHRALAKVLEMPPAHIRVIATPNGGGFGGKSDPFNHEVAVCKLSMKTGRPVKVTLTREEVFYCHRGRHPVKMWVKTGVKKDGSITAMHFRTALDGGGYGSYGVASLYYTGALQTVTYRVPRYKFEGVRVFTNKPPCGPKRGHGTPQPRFALECHIDKICARPGDRPGRVAAAQHGRARDHHGEPDEGAHHRAPDLLRARDRALRLARQEGEARTGPRHRDRGLRVHQRRGAADLLERDAALGRADQGGPRRRRDRVLRLDRHRPGLGFRAGLRGRGGAGHPARGHPRGHGRHRPDACRPGLVLVARHAHDRQRRHPGRTARARADLSQRRPASSRCPVERLRAGGRRIWDAADETKSLSFVEAVVLAEGEFGTLGSVGSYKPPKSVAKWKGAGVGPTPTYSYSAAVVELSADRETGLIRVDKVWIAHDVGRSINPLLVIGQVEGARLHGPGRGADGGAGLPQGPAQDPVAARLQEPDHARDAARSTRCWSRRSIPKAPTAARSAARARCCR